MPTVPLVSGFETGGVLVPVITGVVLPVETGSAGGVMTGGVDEASLPPLSGGVLVAVVVPVEPGSTGGFNGVEGDITTVPAFTFTVRVVEALLRAASVAT